MLKAVVAVLVLYALHQDVWLWSSARPLVFGVLPIGLFYHAVYTIAISVLLQHLVHAHWPSHLEE